MSFMVSDRFDRVVEFLLTGGQSVIKIRANVIVENDEVRPCLSIFDLRLELLIIIYLGKNQTSDGLAC